MVALFFLMKNILSPLHENSNGFSLENFFLEKRLSGKNDDTFSGEKKHQKCFIDKNVDYFPQESFKKEILLRDLKFFQVNEKSENSDFFKTLPFFSFFFSTKFNFCKAGLLYFFNEKKKR